MYQDFYDEHNTQNVLKAHIFGAIKSIMRWAGHVAWPGERCIHDFGGETLGKENTWKT